MISSGNGTDSWQRPEKGDTSGRYKKIFGEAQKLKWGIESLLKLSTFERYGDLSGLHIDYEDSEPLFLTGELRGIMEKLSEVGIVTSCVGNS